MCGPTRFASKLMHTFYRGRKYVARNVVLLLYFKKDFPKQTIAQEAKIRPIWSPWLCSEELPLFQCSRMFREKMAIFFVKKIA
jgi:hypothetical protein